MRKRRSCSRPARGAFGSVAERRIGKYEPVMRFEPTGTLRALPERAKEIAAALQSPYVSIATKYADIMTRISSEFDFTPARRMTGYGIGLGHKHGCVPPSRPRPTATQPIPVATQPIPVNEMIRSPSAAADTSSGRTRLFFHRAKSRMQFFTFSTAISSSSSFPSRAKKRSSLF